MLWIAIAAVIITIIFTIWMVVDFFQIFTQGMGQVGAIIVKVIIVGLMWFGVFAFGLWRIALNFFHLG